MKNDDSEIEQNNIRLFLKRSECKSILFKMFQTSEKVGTLIEALWLQNTQNLTTTTMWRTFEDGGEHTSYI